MTRLPLLDLPPGQGEWESPAPYIAARRTALRIHEGATLALIEIEPGGQVIPHVRPTDLLYLLLAGEATLAFGTERSTVAVGELLSIPAEALRGFANGGHTVARLLEIAPAEPPRRSRFRRR